MKNLFDLRALSVAEKTIRAIKHPDRQKIMEWLEKNPNSSVTGIYTALKMGQSECSNHLSILRTCKVVQNQRDQKEVRYSTNATLVEKLNKIIVSLTKMIEEA
jgi:DNA-binding transcriptional ArsR family regulator